MNRFERNCLVGLVVLAIALSTVCFILQKKHEVQLRLIRDDVHVESA